MIESLQQENERLKKELSFYQKQFSLAESDVALDGYIAYVHIVRQMVNYIKDFNIKSNVEGKKSENAQYERTEKIWDQLPDMISSMNKLKVELGIEYSAEDAKPKQQALRPELIAKQSLSNV